MMNKKQPLHDEHIAQTGEIVQTQKLAFAKSMFHQAMIVWVQQGRKIFRFADGELIVQAGEMALIAENQSFDVLNEPDESRYQAQWLAIGDEPIAQFFQQAFDVQIIEVIEKRSISQEIQAAFLRVQSSLKNQHDERILHARVWELLAWLAQLGVVFSPNAVQFLSKHIRKIIARNPSKNWQIAEIASQLNMSEATLRRHLAQQNTSFRSLLNNVRMMRALTLLQTTAYPIAQIAYEVGYESPARFAARFRQHFACTPSEVRKSNNLIFNELT